MVKEKIHVSKTEKIPDEKEVNINTEWENIKLALNEKLAEMDKGMTEEELERINAAEKIRQKVKSTLA